MNENRPMEMYYANVEGYGYDGGYVGVYDNHPAHPPMSYVYPPHPPPPSHSHPPSVPLYTQEPAYWSMNMHPYRSYYSDVESTSYYGYGINDSLPRIDTNQNAWECSSSAHIEQPTIDTQSEENAATNSNDDEECLLNNEEPSSPEDAWQDDVDPDTMTYEELLDLGEAVGTQSRGLSKELIKLLPTSRYKAAGLFSKKRDKESCIICLMSYKIGDQQIRLPCKHVYHSKCGKKWLSINKACPVCNSEVFGDEPRN